MTHQLPLYLNLFSIFYLILLLLFSAKRFWKVNKAMRQIFFMLAAMIPVLLSNFFVLNGDVIHIYPLFFLSQIASSLFIFYFKRHIDFSLGREIKWYGFTNMLSLAFVLFVCYELINFYGLTRMDQIAYLNGCQSGEFPTEFVVSNLIFFSIYLCYFFVTGFTIFIKKDHTVVEEKFQNLVEQRRLYVRRFWVTIIALYIIVISLYGLVTDFEVEYFYLPLMINLGFFYIAFNAKQYATAYVLDNEYDAANMHLVQEDEQEENPKWKLSTKELNDAVSLIKKLMEEDQVYLNINYSMGMLVNEMELPKYKVAIILKEGFNLTFVSLINAYRIEKAKKLIADFNSEKDTFEGIGYSVGFNSKASFYRAFKKFTGTTPSQFPKYKREKNESQFIELRRFNFYSV